MLTQDRRVILPIGLQTGALLGPNGRRSWVLWQADSIDMHVHSYLQSFVFVCLFFIGMFLVLCLPNNIYFNYLLLRTVGKRVQKAIFAMGQRDAIQQLL